MNMTNGVTVNCSVIPPTEGWMVEFYWITPFAQRLKISYGTTGVDGTISFSFSASSYPVDMQLEIPAGQVIEGVEYKGLTGARLTLYDGQVADEVLHPEPVIAPPPPPGPYEVELYEIYRDIEIYQYLLSKSFTFTCKGEEWNFSELAMCYSTIDECLEPLKLVETFRDVNIYWWELRSVYWASVSPEHIVMEDTIEEARISISEILDFLAAPPEGDWGWPLEAVHSFFENLYDKVIAGPLVALKSFWATHITPKLELVRDKIKGFIKDVQDVLKPIIDGIKTAVGDINTWLTDTLKPIVDGVASTVSAMWTDITKAVSDGLTGLGTALSDVDTWLTDNLKPVVDGIKTSVGEMWTDITDAVGGVITDITASLELAKEWIKDNVIDGVVESVTGFAEAANTFVTDAIAGGLNWVQEAMKGVGTAMGDALSGFMDWLLKKLGYISEMIGGAAQFVMDKLKNIFYPIIAGFMDLLTGTLLPGSPPKEIEIAAQVLSGTLYQRQVDLLDDVHHSPSTYEELFKVATQITSGSIAAGGTAMAAATAADQANPAKNPGFRPTVREIVYWAGIPAVTASIATLPAAIGIVTPMRYFLMERWQPMVPPATDLVRFALREVFIEARFEILKEPTPGGVYYKNMAKQGFNEFWADAYWAAHWVLPSIGQLNEMLYRNTWSRLTKDGVFTPPAGAPAGGKALDDYMWTLYARYNDLIPEARGWLKDIIYKPYTRVDIRRMWDMRVVTEKEVKENYLWLGYDEAHAEKMTLWTKVYTAASDIRALYARGHITGDEVLRAFIDLGVPPERADTFRKKLVDYVGPERTEKERDLTKTDILRMFRNGIFTDTEAKTFLQDIGYSKEEADYLVELYGYQPLVELRELSMSNILKSYRYEIFDRTEAKNALLEGGWSENAAEVLLQLEDIKLADAQIERRRERDLSRTDIIKAIGYEVIDVTTGYNYLGYLGYSDWEIRVIGALEGIEFPEATP